MGTAKHTCAAKASHLTTSRICTSYPTVLGSYPVEHAQERKGTATPVIRALHQRSAVCAQLRSLLRPFQQHRHCTCELLRLIGDEQVLAICHLETFTPQFRGHDCFAHRQRLQNLEPCSAAYPKRSE